jgi:predicted RNA-binding Zn ribbon-like protein
VVFAHDTEVALTAAAELVNSDAAPDELPDIQALDAFLTKWGWSGRRDHTEAELQQVHALRPRLRRFWESDRDVVVELANELLREFQALPQLVKHDEWDYHLHATTLDAPLVARMAVEAAMAMVDVVRNDELSRMRICDMPDCDDVLVDLTRNRSKRYCDLSCSNRAAVSAYRSRQSRPE